MKMIKEMSHSEKYVGRLVTELLREGFEITVRPGYENATLEFHARRNGLNMGLVTRILEPRMQIEPLVQAEHDVQDMLNVFRNAMQKMWEEDDKKGNQKETGQG
jgi:hypothetical protein